MADGAESDAKMAGLTGTVVIDAASPASLSPLAGVKPAPPLALSPAPRMLQHGHAGAIALKGGTHDDDTRDPDRPGPPFDRSDRDGTQPVASRHPSHP